MKRTPLGPSSKVISCRLKYDTAKHIDRLVENSPFNSRADYMRWLVEREIASMERTQESEKEC